MRAILALALASLFSYSAQSAVSSISLRDCLVEGLKADLPAQYAGYNFIDHLRLSRWTLVSPSVFHKVYWYTFELHYPQKQVMTGLVRLWVTQNACRVQRVDANSNDAYLYLFDNQRTEVLRRTD